MNLSVDVQVAIEDDDHPPPSELSQWVELAIDQRMPAAELTIRIVDRAEITQLNDQYRAKNKATNVLSFPADLPDFIDLPLLGDLIICAEVVNQEAEQQHKPCKHHWAHMVVHGTLHLLGYDHEQEQEAALMEGLEIELLARLGIANPYLDLTNHSTNHKTLSAS